MWAATVRRCPNRGYPRHHSHFGTRLQIARALNHAPYLICDPVTYPSCTAGNQPHSHLAYDLPQGQPQQQPQSQPLSQQSQQQQQQPQPDIISDHMLEYNSSHSTGHNHHHQSPVITHELPKNKRRVRSSSLTSRAFNFYSSNNEANNECGIALDGTNDNEDMGIRDEIDDDVRVELPYTRREHHHYQNQDDSLLVGGRVVRRYQEYATARYDDHHDDISSVVGLSYQQRDITTAVPLYEDDPAVLAFSSGTGEDDGPPLLLTRGGKLREVVRTLFVGALSLTLVTFVIMCFPWVSIL